MRAMKPQWMLRMLPAALSVACALASAGQNVSEAEIDRAVTARLASEYGTRSNVVAHLDLTAPFGTRTQWTLVVAKQPDEESKVLSGGGDPVGAVSVCFVHGAEPDCSDARFLENHQARTTGIAAEERAFYQLIASRVVYAQPGGKAPLLELQACSLHGGNGSCLKSTFLFDYDRKHDAFRTVFFGATGTNNNQETRFIESGPLRGRVIVATPTLDAPFGYWVEVYKPGAARRYVRSMKFRSRTRYADGNTLPVIDAEMPELLRRSGLWRKGQALPAPPKRPDGCSALVMRQGVEWCESRLDGTGLGTIRIGLPLDELPISLEQPIQRTTFNPSGACFYVFPSDGSGFGMMIEGEHLTRIDVIKPRIKTDKGISVGDPISKIKAAYGAAAVEARDFYDDSLPEFTIKSADGSQALRFSTQNGRVTAIIAGRSRSVAYVEGCL